jgi:hypothetical protein
MADSDSPVVIDCDRCDARPSACPDCVVSIVLTGPGPAEWDASELRAVDAMAAAGMVPRLRLVSADEPARAPEPLREERRAG